MSINNDPKFHEHLRDWSNATNDDDERAALAILCGYIDQRDMQFVSKVPVKNGEGAVIYLDSFRLEQHRAADASSEPSELATEQVLFDEWVRRTHRKAGSNFNRSHTGDYLDNRVAAKWAAWKARAELPSAVIVGDFTYRGSDGKFLDSGEWWVENSEISNHMALPILRNGKVIALVFSEAHDECKREIEENCRLLSNAGNSRAADALDSQPTDDGAQATQAASIGEAGTMPGTSGFTMAVFKAVEVPVGTKLYLASVPVAPDGWKLVPIKPTSRMTEAGVDARLNGATHMDSLLQWRAMLAAAPTPASSQPTDGGVRNG